MKSGTRSCAFCGQSFSRTRTMGDNAWEKAKYCSRICSGGARATHGHTRSAVTPTYRTWVNMRTRCENPKATQYKFYGGRGIIVCERWKSFEAFLADMGERPSLKHTLDRHPNSSGNYEPGNCRWATQT